MRQASRVSEDRARRSLRLQFPARPEYLLLVRHAIQEMGLPDRAREDATLLTSELVTNSIRHAGLGPGDHIDVTASWSGRVLRVVVRDSGTGGSASGIVAGAIRPSPGGQSGWGLYLVDSLASRWGQNLGGAVGFWFELEVPGEEGGRS